MNPGPVLPALSKLQSSLLSVSCSITQNPIYIYIEGTKQTLFSEATYTVFIHTFTLFGSS